MADFQPARPWTLLGTTAAVMLRPRQTMAALAPLRTLSPPLAFLATLWLGLAVLRGLVALGGGPAVTPWALVQEPLWCLGLGVCLHLSLKLIQHDAPLGRTLRILCYSLGPWLFSAFAPLLPSPAGDVFIVILAALVVGYVYAGLIGGCGLGAPLAIACLIICLVLLAVSAAVVGQAFHGWPAA